MKVVFKNATVTLQAQEDWVFATVHHNGSVYPNLQFPEVIDGNEIIVMVPNGALTCYFWTDKREYQDFVVNTKDIAEAYVTGSTVVKVIVFDDRMLCL